MGELTDIPHGKDNSTATQSTPDKTDSSSGVTEKGSGTLPSPTLSVGKTPNFTSKEKRFLKGMVEEVIPGKKTQRALAVEVYNAKTVATADSIASENLSKPKFKAALSAAFEKAEITTDSLAETLRDAMLATKTAQIAGEIIESDVPDHSIRVTAARAAASLMMAADAEDKPGTGGITLNFNTGTQNFVKTSND